MPDYAEYYTSHLILTQAYDANTAILTLQMSPLKFAEVGYLPKDQSEDMNQTFCLWSTVCNHLLIQLPLPHSYSTTSPSLGLLTHAYL